MKKMITMVAISIMVMVLPHAYGAYTVTWYDTTSGSLFDSSGNAFNSGSYVGVNQQWLFQLVVDVSNNTDVATMIAGNFGAISNEMPNTVGYSTDDDEVVAEKYWLDDGFGSVGIDTSGSGITEGPTYSADQYYIRFFNDNTISGATEIGLIFNSNGTWTVPTVASDTTQNADLNPLGADSADIGGSGDGPGDGGWSSMSVPEPGSMALFGIGLVAMGLRRRKRK